jgi:uncharacterized protein YaiE (UPF0345 family)
MDAEAVSPAVSSTAAQDADFEVSITFDEPVVVADTGLIKFGYYNRFTKDIDWYAISGENVVSNESGELTFSQPITPLFGQYVFLAIDNGAIEDRSGNVFEGYESDFDTDGYLMGYYWRIAFEPTAVIDVMPANDSALITNDFQITVTFDKAMRMPNSNEDGYDPTTIALKYMNEQTNLEVFVPADYVAIDSNVVTISLPDMPDFGQNVTFRMDEGALRDIDGNPSAEIAYGDYQYLISYGYSKDLIVGTYDLAATSYFDGDLTPYSVEITAAGGDTVMIRGLFEYDVAIPGIFDGVRGTLTLSENSSFGDVYSDGGEVFIDNGDSENGGVVVGNIKADGKILMESLGAYYVSSDGTGDGYVDYYTTTTWTPAVAGKKSGKLNTINAVKSMPKGIVK